MSRENFQAPAGADDVPTLYDYWSSSAAYRVRIGLALKGIAYRRVVVRRLDGIEQPDYFAVNPQGFVPTLEVAGERLVQSTAILEYLEERWRDPPLLPRGPDRARAGAGADGPGGRRHPALEQPAGPGRAAGRVSASTTPRCAAGTAAGSPRALPPSSGSWPRARPPAGSATATRRPWPTSAWCRRCSMPGAGRATSSPIRSSAASTPPAASSSRSGPQPRSGKATARTRCVRLGQHRARSRRCGRSRFPGRSGRGRGRPRPPRRA